MKYCIEDSNTINKIIGDKTNDCSDFCFQENVIFDITKGNCICNENFKFEYNNNCYHDCPDNTYPLFSTKYICSSTIPENYYLDNSDNIYKECYYKCKQCSQSGDNNNNNCQQCKENYRFIDDPLSIENNCYSECPEEAPFTELNETKKYECKTEKECAGNYIDYKNKKCLYTSQKKCLEDVKYMSKFKYNTLDCLYRISGYIQFQILIMPAHGVHRCMISLTRKIKMLITARNTIISLPLRLRFQKGSVHPLNSSNFQPCFVSAQTATQSLKPHSLR